MRVGGCIAHTGCGFGDGGCRCECVVYSEPSGQLVFLCGGGGISGGQVQVELGQ